MSDRVINFPAIRGEGGGQALVDALQGLAEQVTRVSDEQDSVVLRIANLVVYVQSATPPFPAIDSEVALWMDTSATPWPVNFARRDATLNWEWVDLTASVTDHSALSNLDFAASGHTGFASVATAQTLQNKTIDGLNNTLKMRRDVTANQGAASSYPGEWFIENRGGSNPDHLHISLYNGTSWRWMFMGEAT